MKTSSPASFETSDATRGIAAWGVNLCDLDKPACALFYEGWQTTFLVGSIANGKKVKVTVLDDEKQPTDKSVVCELRDTLPHECNAGESLIALNLPAFKELGAKAGVLVSWEFVD